MCLCFSQGRRNVASPPPSVWGITWPSVNSSRLKKKVSNYNKPDLSWDDQLLRPADIFSFHTCSPKANFWIITGIIDVHHRNSLFRTQLVNFTMISPPLIHWGWQWNKYWQYCTRKIYLHFLHLYVVWERLCVLWNDSNSPINWEIATKKAKLYLTTHHDPLERKLVSLIT